MAPLPTFEDEFILTLSSDDDSEKLAVAEKSFPFAWGDENGKKRKRKDANEVPVRKRRNTQHGPLQGNRIKNNQDDTRTELGEDDGVLDSDFEFQIVDVDNGTAEDFDGWDLTGRSATSAVSNNKKGVDIDELIARRRETQANQDLKDDVKCSTVDTVDDSENGGAAEFLALGENLRSGNVEDEDETLAADGFGMGVTSNDEEGDLPEGIEDDSGSESGLDEDSVAEPVPHPDDDRLDGLREDDSDDPEELARREAFFAPEIKEDASKKSYLSVRSFQDMSLSRPILRGIASVGFLEPTPIQSKTIPVALLGQDVVGGAVTGSGKTAAFIIPILERLLYRPRKIPTSRVAILMPTRELGVQCFNVAKKLASFTDITFCQMVGGFSLREQESVLRNRPDVIIATPGRFIDHMRNSASFTVDSLEILVLDEADRMLEDGFADELDEILKTIPKSRQTMLFSATMTDKVDKLIRVGLNRPVRLMVDAKKQTVGTLVQEFVRLRPGREDKRLGYLLYLCEKVYTDKVIIFFRQKKEAHRVRIIFGLCGLKATELHGNMTQEQRISSLSSFRTSRTTHLLATDVASRGLDIPSISCVLNYSAPQSATIYLHRVGRTARAGRAGRACTLAAEPDRKVVKDVVRVARAQGAKVVSRVIEAKAADECMARVEALTAEVEIIMGMEKEERALGEAERDVRRGENLVGFEDEIKARPRRTWFETEKEKAEAKARGGQELNGKSTGRGPTKAGVGKLSNKAKKRLDGRTDPLAGRTWKKRRENRSRPARGANPARTKKKPTTPAAAGQAGNRPKRT